MYKHGNKIQTVTNSIHGLLNGLLNAPKMLIIDIWGGARSYIVSKSVTDKPGPLGKYVCSFVD